MSERTVWVVEFLTSGMSGESWYPREEDARRDFGIEVGHKDGAVRLVRLTLDEERLDLVGVPPIPEDRDSNPIQSAVEDVRGNMGWKDASTYAAYGVRTLLVDQVVSDKSVLPWNFGN